ncbi:hypothetical protein LX32DRAFT_691729 [Colletotrichum zoysiae]|uniref:Uncharacterized protein n=1 Tax=Colletotrichum zoysiae TaxID=1216348 RepID=A0AAD9HLX5_9PEZI|nr:hypothetical protein LX32DRAFT_691729 [Colletotrichum zoysiae]
MERVMDKLRSVTDMEVRLASEDDKEDFAGILGAVDRGIGVHADHAPYVTWNILLNAVPGGDTIVYDRQWQAPDDDIEWRKKFPRDSCHPQMLQSHPFKAMEAVGRRPGIRFTVCSFIGFLPGDGSRPDALVLWS